MCAAMKTEKHGRVSPEDLLRLCPAHRITPLVDLPGMCRGLGLKSLIAKDESKRPLGSFKSLGGVYAALNALSRATSLPVADLLDPARLVRELPTLVCASDGNHGLAVAAAARLAGATAEVFLPWSVSDGRTGRIASKGAKVIRVDGTYDDAVDAATERARTDNALLVADTGENEEDPVVADVMAGYGVIASEIVRQLDSLAWDPPTHLFVQAGVGGLAAAMAQGLHGSMESPARIVVVEPMTAPCVAAAFKAGRVVRVPGDLDTVAGMLSCGEASTPAMSILRRHRATVVQVAESDLIDAPAFLERHEGLRTTPSGAAGLAGLRRALERPELASSLELSPLSRVLVILTEGVS